MLRAKWPPLVVLLLTCPLLTLAHQGQGGGGGDIERFCQLTLGQAYTRVEAANLDGDRLPDLVYRTGTTIEVLLSPAVFDVLMTPVATGQDFAVVRGVERDHLLVATNDGLKEVRWDADDVAPGSWVTTSVDTTGWSQSEVDAWEGVSHLTVWSSAPGALQHVFATDALGGDDILWLEPVSGAWVPTIAPMLTPAAVSQLVAFDYDGSGGPELAVTTGTKLSILSPGTAQPLYASSHPALPSTAIAPLRHLDYSREWVGWLRTAASGAQFFCVIGQEGMFNIVSLGSEKAYLGFTAGDCDADGMDDMVYSSTATWDLTWVFDLAEQASSQPNFLTPQPVVEIDGPGVVGGESANQSVPAVVDLDGDGDCDVAYPIRFTGKMWIKTEDHEDETAMQVWPVIEPLVDRDTLLACQVGAVAAAGRKLGLDLELGSEPQGQYLEVTAWRRTSPSAPIQTPPIHHSRISLADLGDVIMVPDFVIEPDVPEDPLVGEDAVFNSLVYVVLEPVDAASENLSDPRTATYPPFTMILHASGNGSSLDNFVNQTPNAMPFEVFTFDGGSSGESHREPIGGGEDVGAGESIPGLPLLPPNTPPRGN